MKRFRRICIVVLDSLGVGELPDAATYHDQGANTFLHTDEACGGLKLPNLQSLGLKQLVGLDSGASEYKGAFCRMAESSRGKDTTTGHWEMMGLVLEKPFHTFDGEFPQQLLKEWTAETGFKFLGNKAASGTEIIKELGDEHVTSKQPIIYFSADSVFQIAAHEEVFGLDQLYKLCDQTRRFLNQSAYQVGRVIARPFIGDSKMGYTRTEHRRDYALTPFDTTTLDRLTAADVPITGVGKIPYIFNFKGITQVREAHNDRESVAQTVEALRTQKQEGVIFSNLNDLDMLYGHRRNAKGYGTQIEWIDSHLQEITKELAQDDLLIITADHGNDPTYRGTDHTREYTPLLMMSPSLRTLGRLTDRTSFADIGKSLLANFNIAAPDARGTSFLESI